jgi:hypothetical protein
LCVFDEISVETVAFTSVPAGSVRAAGAGVEVDGRDVLGAGRAGCDVVGREVDGAGVAGAGVVVDGEGSFSATLESAGAS